MKKEIAIVVAAVLLSVLMVLPVMSSDENATNARKIYEGCFQMAIGEAIRSGLIDATAPVMSEAGDENATNVNIPESIFEKTKGDLSSSAFIANQTNISESDKMTQSVVTIYTPDSYSTVHVAGSNASGRDMSVIYNETYKENAVVNKSIGGQYQTISTSSVTILDHTMCKAIDADNYPIERTTQFYTSDEYAILWYKATDLHFGDDFTKK